MDAYEYEMRFDSLGNQVGTYNFTLVGENAIFFYEQTADSIANAELDILILSESDKAALRTTFIEKEIIEMAERRALDNDRQTIKTNSFDDVAAITVVVTPDASHGYYGRVNVSNTTRNYSSATITLPASNEITVGNGTTLYIYGGFTGASPGGIDADMGVQYSTTYGLWKSMLTINSGSSFLASYDNATNKNGYLPNKAITIVCHPYNDQTNGTKGAVRLKVDGLAKYADKNGNGGNTYLTSIMQSNTIYNFTKVTTHKWVTTLAGSSSSSGRNIGKFSNMTINGSIVPSSSFVRTYDGTCTFSNVANGKITIDIRK